MKKTVLATCLLLSSIACGKDVTPKDVLVFIDNAGACQHFAGEFDGGLSRQRQREIERSVLKYCRAAQKQRTRLTGKYKNDRGVMQIIHDHANDAVISFR